MPSLICFSHVSRSRTCIYLLSITDWQCTTIYCWEMCTDSPYTWVCQHNLEFGMRRDHRSWFIRKRPNYLSTVLIYAHSFVYCKGNSFDFVFYIILHIHDIALTYLSEFNILSFIFFVFREKSKKCWTFSRSSCFAIIIIDCSNTRL